MKVMARPAIAVEIREVKTRHDRDVFVKMPWPLYANDPLWIPPVLMERKEFINPRKHPFLRHGSAAMFLAWRQGQCVGRILVSEDPNYNQEHGTNAGCFGMFESIDDVHVAHSLLDTAADWLRTRHQGDYGSDRLLDELQLWSAGGRL